jgi:trans-aconitate 2-methyltransferase
VTTVPRDTWNPSQYERFHDERRQPFVDLVGLCTPVPGGTAVDLGCGTGALTAELHAASQAAQTTGIDSSAAMVDAALSSHGDVTGLRFERGDIEEWSDEGVDLVFANASFHWVDDHLNLLARMRTSLGPGGQLAFQVPANFRHPSHVLARAVAQESPFFEALDGELPPDRGMAVLAPETYADLLYELGAVRQVVRMEVYGHVLESTVELVEWVQGTLLTAYRSRLDEPTYEAFVERYRERLVEELGDSEPYFYAFRRILCWAAFE